MFGTREARKPSEKQYTRAMLRCIEAARHNPFHDVVPASKTAALRVIKRFESVNGRSFNPFNKKHIDIVAGRLSGSRLMGGLHLHQQSTVHPDHIHSSYAQPAMSNGAMSRPAKIYRHGLYLVKNAS